ncbi:hypothetical protein BROUX41_005883 [Berkeleyomyces rouxiae]|uniref:uncharacterized protein n=1 Tax=Berkeleyomyces rouxiae TaxID=2035830 RepID=UPI003B80D8FB
MRSRRRQSPTSISFMINSEPEPEPSNPSSPMPCLSPGSDASGTSTPTTPLSTGTSLSESRGLEPVADIEALTASIGLRLMALGNQTRRMLSIPEMLASSQSQSLELRDMICAIEMTLRNTNHKKKSEEYKPCRASKELGMHGNPASPTSSITAGGLGAYQSSQGTHPLIGHMDKLSHSLAFNELPRLATTVATSPLLQYHHTQLATPTLSPLSEAQSTYKQSFETPELQENARQGNVETSTSLTDETQIRGEEKDVSVTATFRPPVHRKCRSREKPSPEKPADCSLCERSGFTDTSKLNKHKKTHTRPHICPGCGMSFATPRDMRRHARRHQDVIEVWQCTCKVTFTRDYNLHRHMRTTKRCKPEARFWTANHGGRRAPITKAGFKPEQVPSKRVLNWASTNGST